MNKGFIVDAGPFIHLSQISQIALLEKFPSLFVPPSIISEISVGDEALAHKISNWANLKIMRGKEKLIPKIERAIKKFSLHAGERDVIYLSAIFDNSVVLTDDLNARSACESLAIEVHGSVGIIAYSFYRKRLSFPEAQEALVLLSRKSNLFVSPAIIEHAIAKLGRYA